MSYSKTSHSSELPLTVAIILFILIIGSGIAIFFIKDFSKILLGFYCLLFLILIILNKKIPRNLSGVFRALVGCLFIFSGFVKGVDPTGFSYKIYDYLEAYGMAWFEPASMVLAIIACLIEFTTGIMLLLDIKPKLSTIIASIMMLGFTILTLIDATHNMVPDCGCFGDAVKMSNWQTFYKNLTIDLCLLTVWFSFNKIKPLFYPGAEIGIIVVFMILFLALELFCLIYLPIIDFRDWKVGKKMTLENPVPVEYWCTYVNDSTQEEKNMLIKDIPYTDSAWMTHWKFKEQHTIDKNVYPHNVLLFDESGTNVTNDVLSDTKPNIMIVSYSLNDMHINHIDKLKAIVDYCEKHEYNICFITATEFEAINKFAKQYGLDINYYNADETELKAMIRSNPGVMAMKNGVVLKKWSNNNLPNIQKLDEYLK